MGKAKSRMCEISDPKRDADEAQRVEIETHQEYVKRIAKNINARTPSQLRREQETARRNLRHETRRRSRRELSERAIRESRDS